MRRAFIIFTCVTLLGATSCGGSKNNMSPSGNLNGTFTATIDGKSFTAAIAILALRTGNTVSANATDATNNTLGFAVIATAPGTYTIPGSGAQLGNNASLVAGTVGSPSGWVADAFKGSGTVKIDALTATGMSGTFSFVLVPSGANSSPGNKTVTNGKFDVKFTSAAG